MSQERTYMAPVSRLYGFLLIFLLCSIALVARAVNLQVVDTEFLQDQGEARYLREVVVPTRRGNILDRNGEPLAVSTPVDSVWVNPKVLLQSPGDIEPLANVLDGVGLGLGAGDFRGWVGRDEERNGKSDH